MTLLFSWSRHPLSPWITNKYLANSVICDYDLRDYCLLSWEFQTKKNVGSDVSLKWQFPVSIFSNLAWPASPSIVNCNCFSLKVMQIIYYHTSLPLAGLRKIYIIIKLIAITFKFKFRGTTEMNLKLGVKINSLLKN